MSEPITILIVDDHAVVREGARAFLDAQPDFNVVGDVGSGGEAVLVAADLAPDVVLMDLVMPGMDGVEATRRLKQRSPRSQVIVLTSYHDDEHVFPAIRAGALSYLLKDVLLHVSNILSKLQLTDRTQAAVFAWREGLVPHVPGHRGDASFKDK